MNKPIYLKELADYSYVDLKLKTAFTDKQLLNFREKLLEKGLAKSSSKKDFVFNYVGLIYFEQKIMYVLHKYIDNDLNLDEAKRLSKVIIIRFRPRTALLPYNQRLVTFLRKLKKKTPFSEKYQSIFSITK